VQSGHEVGRHEACFQIPCHTTQAAGPCTSVYLSLVETDYDRDEPHFFGRRLNVSGSDFFSGGSTNIMSRAALQQLGDAIKTRGSKVLRMGDTFADDLCVASAPARPFNE
jgi:coproporphyrinogen III oxidase-like Fe-S oxidoreductase